MPWGSRLACPSQLTASDHRDSEHANWPGPKRDTRQWWTGALGRGRVGVVLADVGRGVVGVAVVRVVADDVGVGAVLDCSSSSSSHTMPTGSVVSSAERMA
jgi:hypothetical protein